MEPEWKVQTLNFELMETVKFNGCDGRRVVESLRENHYLWLGVVMDSASYCWASERGEMKIDLTKLRDIVDGYWNVDTLYILPAYGQEDALYNLARDWDADEVEWIDKAKAIKLMRGSIKSLDYKKAILRVWWD